MIIDKEVPENYFRSDYHKALINIFFTSHWLLEKVKFFLEKEDITPQQYNIMRILNHSEAPLSTLRIRELMLDKMSDTSRIVERLLKKNLVNKQVSRQDKRLVDITLTPLGKELINKLEGTAAKGLDDLLSKLNSEEIIQLNNLLDSTRI